MTRGTRTDDGVPLSADGYERLRLELDALRTDARRDLAGGLREARQGGDIADNVALYELLEEQAKLEGRIALLESRLAAAEIAAPPADGTAGVGTVVRVRDGDGAEFDYELVGPFEGAAGEDRVSIAAPVGLALVGRSAGDRVTVETPRGTLALEIVAVGAGRFPAAA